MRPAEAYPDMRRPDISTAIATGNMYGRFQVVRQGWRWVVISHPRHRPATSDDLALNLRFWRNINACRVAQVLFIAECSMANAMRHQQ